MFVCTASSGALQLAVSVYHPILFGALYKLLRAKCFSCHNLRLSKTKTRVAAVKVRDGRKLALCGTQEGEVEGVTRFFAVTIKSYPCLTRSWSFPLCMVTDTW